MFHHSAETTEPLMNDVSIDLYIGYINYTKSFNVVEYSFETISLFKLYS